MAGAPQVFSDFGVAAPHHSQSPERIAGVVRAAYADALSRGAPEATFRARLSKVGVDAGAVDVLASALYKGRGAVVSSARQRIAGGLVAGGGGRVLTDFDWGVSHVVSSDKLASVGEPLVHLSLRLGAASPPGAAGGAGGETTVRVELAAEDLEALVQQLETAQASMAAVAASGGGASGKGGR